MTGLFWAALIGIAVSACSGGGGDSPTGGATTDTVAPTVSSTSPANNAIGIATNAAISATFSETIPASNGGTAAFTLSDGVANVSGTVAYSGATVTFTPASPLSYSTPYTATISGSVKDAAGNAMSGSHAWTFTTGAAPDTTAPTVAATSPAHNATGVATNVAITATFSETMTAASFNTSTFILNQGVNGVPGVVSYDGTTATFTPSSALAYSTTYTATVSSSVTDAAGNPMAANQVWIFTTGAAPDATPPTVTATSPTDTATAVAINTAITATFSETMTAASFNAATFTLSQGATPVPGAVTYSGSSATLTPVADLAASTTYTATITSGVKDAAGNFLAGNRVWSFTTASARSFLTDTGITAAQCYAPSSYLVACNSAEALALNDAQDGMRGRDVSSADNADGKLGFSYSAVAGGCVQDNITGLMWEVKTADGGLRDGSNTYTNSGAVGFRNSVNSQTLCGYSDWRLPTADELQSLVDYGVAYPGPTIDTTWFPNTPGYVFWSSPYGGAWNVNFFNGEVGQDNGNSSYHVRLVRAGQ